MKLTNLLQKELAETTSNTKKLAAQCKNDNGMEKPKVFQRQNTEALDPWTELKGILKKESRFKSRLSREASEIEQNKEEAYVVLEETARILRGSLKMESEDNIKKTKVKIGGKVKYPWSRAPRGKWKVKKDGKVLCSLDFGCKKILEMIFQNFFSSSQFWAHFRK